MSDAADKSAELQETMNQSAVEQHIKNNFTVMDSADDCVECGLQIPSARQLAVPGTQHCIECANDIERGLL